MTAEQFEQDVLMAVTHLRNFCPEDTGNLKYNAIKYERVSKSEYKIYVDEKVAPYMPFTKEPWISPKWNGKKNPNEKWFDNASDYIARYFANIYSGNLKKVNND